LSTLKKTRLPVDANGNAVQALHPRSKANQEVAFTNVSALSEVLVEAEIVRISSSKNCRVRFGDSSITALITDTFLKSDTPEYFSLRGDTYIAVIRDAVSAESGTLYITIMD
jgi:hypothetical protein